MLARSGCVQPVSLLAREGSDEERHRDQRQKNANQPELPHFHKQIIPSAAQEINKLDEHSWIARDGEARMRGWRRPLPVSVFGGVQVRVKRGAAPWGAAPHWGRKKQGRLSEPRTRYDPAEDRGIERTAQFTVVQR